MQCIIFALIDGRKKRARAVGRCFTQTLKKLQTAGQFPNPKHNMERYGKQYGTIWNNMELTVSVRCPVVVMLVFSVPSVPSRVGLTKDPLVFLSFP